LAARPPTAFHKDTFENTEHNKRQIMLHTSRAVPRAITVYSGVKNAMSRMIGFSRINTHILVKICNIDQGKGKM